MSSTCWCRPPICSTSTPEALTCAFAGVAVHGEGAAVVGTEHHDLGESHVGRRTLSVSDQPAQGCGDGRPAAAWVFRSCPFNSKAKLLVADTGANPVGYGNPQLLLNFDGLKQLLYGPIDGPPRNPAQVGQQG